VNESVTSIFMSPPNPAIAGREIEDGVAYSKEPDQASILAVSNKESEPAAETLGDGHRPQQARESEEAGFQRFGSDLDKFRIDRCGIDLPAGREMIC
jgi:hypothetical protein